jgi:hypothetical protein
MLLEIRCRPKMPELMRRHVNADVPRKGVDDLLRYGGLALPAAPFGDEEMAIHVGAEARQYVTAIPSKAASNFVRDLGDDVLSLGLRMPGGNVKY